MNPTNKPTVRYSVALLVAAGKRFVKAYKSDAYGPQVLEGLAPEFPTDYEAALAKLEELAGDQTIAKGAVHVLTKAQRDALDDVRLYAGSARLAAKDAFVGQDALLHSDFQVGESTPQDLASIILRTTNLIAACKAHAEPLAAQGWPAAHTTALENAVKALDDASIGQDGAGEARSGLTAQKANLADAFYRQCRALQCVARVVYSAKKARRDGTVREARGLFLLDVFPPRRSQTLPPEEPPASNGGTAPTGSTPAGGTTAGSTPTGAA